MPGVEQISTAGRILQALFPPLIDTPSSERRPGECDKKVCRPVDSCDVDRALPPLPFALYLKRQNQKQAEPPPRPDDCDGWKPSAFEATPPPSSQAAQEVAPASHGLRGEWLPAPAKSVERTIVRATYERRAVGAQGQLIDVLL